MAGPFPKMLTDWSGLEGVLKIDDPFGRSNGNDFFNFFYLRGNLSSISHDHYVNKFHINSLVNLLCLNYVELCAAVIANYVPCTTVCTLCTKAAHILK